MIAFFDRFVDTHDKRYYLFALLSSLMMLLVVSSYLILSYQLISLSRYDDIYELLKHPIMEYTYVSRFVVSNMSIASLHLTKMGSSLISSLSLFGVISCFVCFLWLYECWQKYWKLIMVLLSVFFLGFLVFVILLLSSYQAMSLQVIIDNLKIIGYVFMMQCLFYSSFLIYIILRYILVKYRNALCYQVEEIKL